MTESSHPPLDHISVSQIVCYARCPAQYQRIYIDRIRKPPGIALLVGGGVHRGAEHAMRAKATSGVNQPPNDVVDAAVAGFDERLEAEDVTLTAEERSIGRLNIIGQTRDRIAAASHYWSLVSQPDYQPASAAAVEYEFRIPMPKLGRDFVGVIDLIDDKGRIIDWKTGKRSLAGEEKYSLQLTAYALWYRRFNGVDPNEVRLDTIRDGKKTSRQVLVSHRSDVEYMALLQRIKATLDAIQRGSFPPCNPGNWWCSPRYCGFHASCPFVVSDVVSSDEQE